MSNNKVDIMEVEEFSNDLQESSTDIRASLDKVHESVEEVNSMDSFSGQAAKEAKRYFSEMHLTIIESFRGLFGDLEENLIEHIKAFENKVDASESTVIESNYLQDVKEDINEVFDDLEKQDEIIHETIEEVSDISSATPPSFSEVDEWKKKATRQLKELDEDLASYTSTGNETDVKELINQIETVMNNAKTSEGEARFADFKGASDNSELTRLMNYNEDKKLEERKEEARKKKIEQEKIDNLDSEAKGYLNRIEEAYENEQLNKADYEELRSVILNESTEATINLLATKLENESDESNSLNETFINIINGGAAATRVTLEELIKGKGYDKVASIINKAVAENTLHFSNLGGVSKLAGAGGGDFLVPMLPKLTSGAVRIGAKYLPSFLGSIVDYNVQVHVDGEDATDAAIKAGAHGVISAVGGAIGFAVGGPIGGVLLGAGIGYLGSEGFDAIYDNAGDIWEGTKNFVGDAVSGLTDTLGTIFG